MPRGGIHPAQPDEACGGACTQTAKDGGEAAKSQCELENQVEKRTADLRTALSEIHALKDQLEAENIYFRRENKAKHQFERIIGESDSLKYALYRAEQVAPANTTVLILGETGVGKELIAYAVHDMSPRKERPLITVNCAALPGNLIESELFGREKGAFTGADTRQIGRFEIANGSTLCLDEIGELPLEVQAKLLRVIQHNEFERLGSSQDRQSRCADHRDDQSGPWGRGPQGAVSAGPVLSAKRFPHHRPAATAAERRHSADGPGLHRAIFQKNGQTDHVDPEGDDEGASGVLVARERPGAGEHH